MTMRLPIFFFFLAVLGTQNTFAQAPELESEEVRVRKAFNATLAEAKKIDIPPTLPPPDTNTVRQQYVITPQVPDVDYPPPAIRPLAYRGEELPDIYHFFGKLGAGLPGAILGELSYDNYVEQKLAVNFLARHHRMNQPDVEHQKFNTTEGRLGGTYFSDRGFALGANVGYQQDNFHYFGYNERLDTMGILEDDVAQNFKTLDLGVQFFNSVPTLGDLNYKGTIDFYNLADNYASTERGFDMNLHLLKYFMDKHSAEVRVRTDVTSFSNRRDESQSLNNYFLEPAFNYHADNFKVHLGGRIANHDDSFSLFPDINASANLYGSRAIFFLGVDGNFEKNNFRNMTTYNPWLVSDFELRNTRYFEYYAGFKGEVGILEYSGQAGYKTADDLALFQRELDAFNPIQDRFNVVYDTVNIFNLKGSVALNPYKGVEILGTFSQNVYDPTIQEKAWHLPATTVTAGLNYTTEDQKFKGGGTLFVENGVPFLNDEGVADRLNGLLDVSLAAEYSFAERFGAFAQLNNLLNNKRQRWANYPTFGINFLVGVNAKF